VPRNSRPHLTLIALAALVAVVAFQASGPSAAEAIEVDPVIWQLSNDYPETLPGDFALPISTIYIKTHDAADWMSTYDDHPAAVSGPEAIQNLIDIYGAQGIAVAAWFVPKGTDYDAQLQLALAVIDSGVTALYADLEPFP
jgi:nitrous oxide reductase accessory protein NosL